MLWPDPILQLNPAYESGPTLDDLAAKGVILPGTAKFFRRADGGPIRLYKHQDEAIEIARKNEPYVVTTGTGSGKSLDLPDPDLRPHPAYQSRKTSGESNHHLSDECAD